MPKLPKILIISESIDVEDSSGTKGRVALIHNLKRIGCELKILHYTRKDVTLNGISTIAIKENRSSFNFFLSRTERHLRKTLKIDIHKTLEKIFGFSFTLMNDRDSIVRAIRKNTDFSFDYILTLSKGGSFRPHHALLKMPDLHHKWIAYIHDPYPMHLYPRPFAWVEPGYDKKWDFIYKISKQAKYSAFPSKLLLEWMGSYFPNFSETGLVIPHQISAERIEMGDFPSYFDPGKFNILHAGNLLGPRNPSVLVRAFLEFLELYPEAQLDARLLFLGNNRAYEKIQKVEKSNSNIIFSKGYIAFNQVLNMQNKAAVNIILEAKSEISPFLPGKFPHCINADRPILLLGPAMSESRRLLGNDYPYWAEIDDKEKIIRIIRDLYINWKKDPEDFFYERKDLKAYLSEPFLKEKIAEISQS